MKKNHYTIRTLMARMGMTYPGASSLIRRMKKHGFAKFVDALPLNMKNTTTKVFVYELLIDPEDYLRGVRASMGFKIPKSTFYNNPFKLRGAVDARYNP
jgi:hypothetical protein